MFRIVFVAFGLVIAASVLGLSQASADRYIACREAGGALDVCVVSAFRGEG